MSLKSKNQKYLVALYVFNVFLLYSFLINGFISLSSLKKATENWPENVIIVSLITLFAIILNTILSSTQKTQLVYFRRRNPLPGCRAFSELVHQDARINKEKLQERIGLFPDDPGKQNAKWYQLLKKYEADLMISSSHGLWLLTRDATAISGIFLMVFLISALASMRGWPITVFFLLIFVMQFITVSAAARNAGNGLVKNVLAKESSYIE